MGTSVISTAGTDNGRKDHRIEALHGATHSLEKKGCFAVVITQREAISLQDVSAGKLNKHRQ